MAQKTKFIKTKAERTIVNTKPGKIIDIIDSSDNKKNISSMKKKVVNTKPGEVVEVIDTVSNAKKTSSKKIKKQLIVSKKPSTSRSTISKSTAISVPKNFPNNARLVSSSSRVISDGSSKKSNATVVVNIFESRGEERGRTVSNNVVSEQVPVAYVNDTNTSKIIKNNVRQVVQEENDEVIVAPKKKKHFPWLFLLLLLITILVIFYVTAFCLWWYNVLPSWLSWAFFYLDRPEWFPSVE